VVRLVGLADLVDGARRQVLRVRRRGEVLERLVVRDVVLAEDARQVRVRLRVVVEGASRLSFRPFTDGVSSRAVNDGSPDGFAASGYVAK
jgi:hypothetical protein